MTLDDIVREFLVERYENLDRLDQALVALETRPADSALLADIFRTIHTLKGTAGFLAFTKLEAISHVGENLLSALRDQKLTLTPGITSTLLRMVDAVRALLRSIEATGAEDDRDYAPLIADLTRQLSADTNAIATATATANANASADADGAAWQPGDEDRRSGEDRRALNDDRDRDRRQGVSESSLRVDVGLLDKLMNLVGELVLARNQIVQFTSTQHDSSFLGATQRLNLVTSELQEGVMKTRMQPIDNVWSKFPRLVRDLATACGKLVTDALSADDEVEVAAIAANGSIALQRIPQVNPDVVTLDVEMPEMDGLETLKQLRRQYPRLPVIMFSTLTRRGAEATLDALALRATDYVTKPANIGSVTLALQSVREQLLPKIKALGKPLGLRQPAAGTPAATVSGRPSSLASSSPASSWPASALPAFGGESADTIDVIAIGVSTGGPNALAEILPALPVTLPVPIVIVQHMPPMFTRLLAERLDAQCAIAVSEAFEGSPLRPGHALIAPGDRHMRVVRRGTALHIALNQGPHENSCRPAVDPLFRSVAEIYGSATLAVILTGMGHDGLRGCEHVRAHGGRVFIQDEATSVVWGMPGFVARAGLAERSLPLTSIAAQLVRATMTRRPSTHLESPHQRTPHVGSREA